MKILNIKDERGFTLAELLVVIAILGILTVIVMVNFESGKHANSLQKAGTELLQDLRLAQNYTIGGNSLNYCIEAAGENFFGNYCDLGDGTLCDDPGNSDLCKNGVPLGGYGINIASTENYRVFADTNNNQELDIPNRVIILRDFSLKGIHVSSFKLGNQSAEEPAADNYIYIMFIPPTGQINFWVKLSGESQMAESQEIVASLLVSSDYVPNSCRKISINRISGQISESQSECSL